MTLNITALAQDAVYQSADFRLWDPEAKKIIADSSTKTVTIRGWEWEGTLTYTGVGRFDRRDTAQWVLRWLEGREGLSFDEVVEVVRAKGSAWLREVGRTTGELWPHTFVVAAFLEGRATAAVISNFESIGQPLAAQIRLNLETSVVCYRDRPVVLVTGCAGKVVSRQQRRALERIVRDYGNDPARIRNSMQELNRQAAQLANGPRCQISEECVVQSFNQFGEGRQSGRVAGARIHELFDGVDVGAMMEKAVKQIFGGGNFELVGATSATSRSGGISGSCTPELSTVSTSRSHELVQLGSLSGVSAAARSVNSSGLVVGESSRSPGSPLLQTCWLPDRTTVFLDGLGGITGQALAVNDSGLIVGTVEDPERRSVACRWNGDLSFGRLSVDGATHSGAVALNEAGDAVGWASFHPTEGGQKHFRPVIWPSDGIAQVMHDIPAEWGQAVAINEDRQVLVSAYIGMRIFPILCQGDRVTPLVGDNQYMIPVALDRTGRVLGWTRDDVGQARAMTWSVDSGWTMVGTGPGWYVKGMSMDGVIVGFVDAQGFRRPWILNPGSDPQILPHYAYHYNEVNAIHRSGFLCGQAVADHGSHALMWRPSS